MEYYILFTYLFIMNISGFLMMGIDKNRARKRLNRIREKSLFTVAIIGGSIGSYVGMQVFRHKTKHVSFMLGIPMIIVLQGLLALYIWRNGML